MGNEAIRGESVEDHPQGCFANDVEHLGCRKGVSCGLWMRLAKVEVQTRLNMRLIEFARGAKRSTIEGLNEIRQGNLNEKGVPWPS